MKASSDFLPARWTPLLYFGLGHSFLAAAFSAIAVDPAAFAGFYYHPRLVAAVHMVTLGWITSSILGALYLVAPLALRTPLPARRADAVAFVAFAVGVTGIVSHFWIDRLLGVAWAAPLVLAAVGYVGGRVVLGLRRAKVAGEARLPVSLAVLNVLAAALVGVLLAVNKVHAFLPGTQLQTVIGHAHLAVLGWPVMMVLGAGYRLLPMMLPSAMPRGFWPYASTVLLQLGAWGLFIALLWGGRGLPFAAALAGSGILVFLAQVRWMTKNRRPPPTDRRVPDLPLGHVAQALLYLLLTAALGLALLLAPPSEASLRLAMAYGAVALIGFLSQMIIGVAARLLPLYGWLWGFADHGYRDLPPSQHRAIPRAPQAFVLLVWTLGVPSFTLALTFDRLCVLRVASGALAASVVVSAAALAVALRRLWRRLPRGEGTVSQ